MARSGKDDGPLALAKNRGRQALLALFRVFDFEQTLSLPCLRFRGKTLAMRVRKEAYRRLPRTDCRFAVCWVSFLCCVTISYSKGFSDGESLLDEEMAALPDVGTLG